MDVEERDERHPDIRGVHSEGAVTEANRYAQSVEDDLPVRKEDALRQSRRPRGVEECGLSVFAELGKPVVGLRVDQVILVPGIREG